jgi:hypothetical protein
VRVFCIMKMISATVISAAAQTPTQTRPVRVPLTCWRASLDGIAESAPAGGPSPDEAGAESTGIESEVGLE